MTVLYIITQYEFTARLRLPRRARAGDLAWRNVLQEFGANTVEVDWFGTGSVRWVQILTWFLAEGLTHSRSVDASLLSF